MIDILNKTLGEALVHAGLQDLPEEYDNNYVWAKAIALVTKNNGQKNYVVVKQRNGNPVVIADFGSIGIIVKFDAIYPYLAAENLSAQLPTRQERIRYLSGYYQAEDVKKALFKMTSEQLGILIDNIAIDEAILREKQDKLKESTRHFWDETGGEDTPVVEDGIKAYTEEDMPIDKF